MEKIEAPARKHGRPTKKTPQMVTALLEAIATGAPYTICCSAVGVHLDTFLHWKATDPVFAAQVEQVAGDTALRMLKKIEQHGEESFQPLAWILERRFPNSFSKPEIQLNVQNNVSSVTNNHFEITFEMAERLDSRTTKMETEIQKLIDSRRAPVLDA